MNKTIESTKPQAVDKVKLASRAVGVALAGVLVTACGGSAAAHKSPAAHESAFSAPNPDTTESVAPPAGDTGGGSSPRTAKADLCKAIPTDTIKKILHEATVYNRSGEYACTTSAHEAAPGHLASLIYDSTDEGRFFASDSEGAQIAAAVGPDTYEGQNSLDLFMQNHTTESLTVDGHPAAFAPSGLILVVDAYGHLISTTMAGHGEIEDAKRMDIEIAEAVLQYGFDS